MLPGRMREPRNGLAPKLAAWVCGTFPSASMRRGWHDAFLAEVSPWVASGELRYREDIREGLEVIPTAFAEMLRGENFGKTLVRVAPDPTLTS